MITPSQAEIFRRALDRRGSELWTSIPGIVQSFDPTTDEADVLPAVRQPLGGYDGDDPLQHEPLPVLPGVPVVFPAGGGCSVRWALAPGDAVLVVFATLNPAAWRRSGAVGDAGTTRRNALGYGFALAGVGPRAMGLDAPTGLELDGPEITIGKGATHPIARGDAVVAWLNAMIPGLTAPPTPPPDFPTTADCLSPKGKIL